MVLLFGGQGFNLTWLEANTNKQRATTKSADAMTSESIGPVLRTHSGMDEVGSRLQRKDKYQKPSTEEKAPQTYTTDLSHEIASKLFIADAMLNVSEIGRAHV